MFLHEKRYRNYLFSTICLVVPLAAGAGVMFGIFSEASVLSTTIFTGLTGCLIAVASVTKNYRKYMLPIINTSNAIQSMTNGDLSKRLPLHGTDEISLLAASFNSFASTVQGSIRLMSDNATQLQVQTGSLQTCSEIVIKQLQTTANNVLGADQAAQGLQNVIKEAQGAVGSIAGEICAAQQKTSAIIPVMNRAREGTLNSQHSVSSIATAAEQMSMTVSEIARNSEHARSSTEHAVQSVGCAQKRVDELGIAATEINKIIDVIVEIAEQTKLLALNATIEAARAGEAGKGFAVVAGEVKDLAKQTSDATNDIRQKIATMQSSTEHTIREITHINGVIGEVDKLVATIAASVEEQSITTRDISGNIRQVATIVADMTDVTQDSVNEIHTMCDSITKASQMASLVTHHMDTACVQATTIAEVIRETKSTTEEALSVNNEMQNLYEKVKQISTVQKQVSQKFRV